MLANETTRENLKSTKPRMKDGEEPTEVLLGLVSSPLLALKDRGLAQIMTAKGENGQPIVLAVFTAAVWSEIVGIVPAPTVANTTNEEKNAVHLPD
jgi:hypothetical protein